MFRAPELFRAEMAALLGAKTVTLDREFRGVTIEGYGFSKAASDDKESVLPIRLERLCAETSDAEKPATKKVVRCMLIVSSEDQGRGWRAWDRTDIRERTEARRSLHRLNTRRHL